MTIKIGRQEIIQSSLNFNKRYNQQVQDSKTQTRKSERNPCLEKWKISGENNIEFTKCKKKIISYGKMTPMTDVLIRISSLERSGTFQYSLIIITIHTPFNSFFHCEQFRALGYIHTGLQPVQYLSPVYFYLIPQGSPLPTILHSPYPNSLSVPTTTDTLSLYCQHFMEIQSFVVSSIVISFIQYACKIFCRIILSLIYSYGYICTIPPKELALFCLSLGSFTFQQL